MNAPDGVERNVDERTLVLRAQDGDTSAFEGLVDRHQGLLFRIAYLMLGDRQDSEDVVQESLLLAWKRLHLLDNPDRFRSWLSRICSRRATDLARRRSRRSTQAQPPEAMESRGDERPESDPARTTQVHAQLHALAQVLATLGPDLRSCWALREVEGMTYLEVARTLGITEATARGRIARARTQVIKQMQEWR